jgi:high-affinity Fe2+/Pb2+ permease
MGLFKNPRRMPDDTRASYARRRAPYLIIIAIVCTVYALMKQQPGGSNTIWIGVFVMWVAAVLSAYAADWSDLRK